MNELICHQNFLKCQLVSCNRRKPDWSVFVYFSFKVINSRDGSEISNFVQLKLVYLMTGHVGVTGTTLVEGHTCWWSKCVGTRLIFVSSLRREQVL